MLVSFIFHWPCAYFPRYSQRGRENVKDTEREAHKQPLTCDSLDTAIITVAPGALIRCTGHNRTANYQRPQHLTR